MNYPITALSASVLLLLAATLALHSTQLHIKQTLLYRFVKLGFNKSNPSESTPKDSFLTSDPTVKLINIKENEIA